MQLSTSEWHLPLPIKNDSGYSISVYDGEKLGRVEIEQATNRLAIAFPDMRKEFFVLLTEFIIKEGFTKERLSDAVNNVIATFKYKEINISDIISYDKRVKLYTYSEVTSLVTQGKASFGDFEIRKVDGKKYRVLKSDLNNY